MKISLGKIFSGLFVVAGLATCGGSFSTYKEYKSSANWAETSGQITRSHIVSKTYPERPGRCFTPEIEYVYSVNDLTYKSRRIYFSGISCSGKKYAKRIVKKFPINTSVRVYYDENYPQNSVIQRTGGKKIIFTALLGIVFSFLGIGAWKLIVYSENYNKKT